ncbi:MAG: type II secretion system F family protein [Tissierellia bacterium]|nr:type II secretion system F family protein [Tissierellia bacterium]
MKYKIKALDYDNKVVFIKRTFDDEENCIKSLKNSGYRILDIHEIGGKDKAFNLRFSVRESKEWQSLFVRQLSILLLSGINLDKSLDILLENEKNSYSRKIITTIKESILLGMNFSQSLRETKIFSKSVIEIAKVGENTGELGNSLNVLANYLDDEIKLKKSINSALFYPIVLLSTTFVVIAYLMGNVFPVFTSMFAESQNGYSDLPNSTKSLIAISNFFREYHILLLIIALIIVIVIKTTVKNNKVKLLVDRSKLRLPLIGKFYQKSIIARFTKLLNILIESDVNIVSSLEVIRNAVDNTHISNELKNTARLIESGESLYNALSSIKIFPNIFLSMINVGEKTGNLKYTVSEISKYYEDDFNRYTKRFISLFEPLMIIFLSLIVGYIVVSIALPTFKIINLV